MITCRLMGGLGNQLFQIFATIAYSIKNNTKFIFPYTEILYAGINRVTYWENFLNPLKMFTTSNEMLCISNDDLNTFPEVPMFHHNYSPITVEDNSKLVGYFQSYMYFEEHVESILSLIRLNKQQTSVKEEFSQYFGEDIYTISMHFRLGDYKNAQESHNILPFHYYKLAIDNIMYFINSYEDKKKTRVLYFCEKEDNADVDIVIHSLRQQCDASIEYIKVTDDMDDWKQLLLMSCCDSNIIANSTFSWWGAYFNRNSDKHVYYPSVWFGPRLHHNFLGDMFPKSWIRINI